MPLSASGRVRYDEGDGAFGSVPWIEPRRSRMTTYDAVMVGLLIAGMIWGAWRGITWQLASIASLVLGYLVAFPMSGQLAPRFPGEPIVARSLALMAVYAA